MCSKFNGTDFLTSPGVAGILFKQDKSIPIYYKIVNVVNV